MISVFDGMLGSEEEQRELKRWTDVNFSKLHGLEGEKAALADEQPDLNKGENKAVIMEEEEEVE